MARILIVSCNTTVTPYPVFPLGATLVADAAKKAGHEVEIYDVLAEDKTLAGVLTRVKEIQPDVIGLSLRNIDNIAYDNIEVYFQDYQELSEVIHQISDATLVLGGAGYSLFPEVLLEKLGADYGIVGEGEQIFCKLVNDLENGKPPEDRILEATNMQSWETREIPSRESHLTEYYTKFGGMLNLQTKRGCPHRCVYCSYPVLEGKKYRYRPVDLVADEIEYLVESCGATYISITDSVFNDAHDRYLEIAEELVRRENQIPWMAYFRPGKFREKDVQLLRRSGLVSVEWGSDATTDSTLEGMQKDFCWADVRESNRLFADEGIANAHFVIFGGPNETPDTVGKGLDHVAELQNSVVFAFTGVRVLPGTPIQKRAIRENVISADQNLLEPNFYFSPDTPPDFLVDAISEGFAGDMTRVFPPGTGESRIGGFHKLGYKGPIWDYLLGSKKRRKSAS